MDLRQTAVNTLSYQLERAPKLTPPARRHRGSEPRSANVHAARDPPRAAAGPTVVKAGRRRPPKQVSSTLNQPHRGFRPTDGATKTWSGRIV